MDEYEIEKREHLAAPPVTVAMADHEAALNVAREHEEREWILSDRDVWYHNPFYTGKPGPHPEEDTGD